VPILQSWFLLLIFKLMFQVFLNEIFTCLKRWIKVAIH
jgi:hypothetical protein